MRALILALSILAIVNSAHFAKAGLSSTPRETLTTADTSIVTDEATQKTEEQIGLTKTMRRKVQRGLTRLGFDTKVNGKFDELTLRRYRALAGEKRLPCDWLPQRHPE